MYRIVTDDRTWLYYYDVPIKIQNKAWFIDDDTPVVIRKSQSVKKKIIVVFFNVNKIVDHVVLVTQKTDTAKYTE